MTPEIQTFVGIGGQLRYRCPDCGFDTYEQKLLIKHWLSAHKEQEVAPPTLFDADDKPLRKDIIFEELPWTLK